MSVLPCSSSSLECSIVPRLEHSTSKTRENIMAKYLHEVRRGLTFIKSFSTKSTLSLTTKIKIDSLI